MPQLTAATDLVKKPMICILTSALAGVRRVCSFCFCCGWPGSCTCPPRNSVSKREIVAVSSKSRCNLLTIFSALLWQAGPPEHAPTIICGSRELGSKQWHSHKKSRMAGLIPFQKEASIADREPAFVTVATAAEDRPAGTNTFALFSSFCSFCSFCSFSCALDKKVWLGENSSTSRRNCSSKVRAPSSCCSHAASSSASGTQLLLLC
mmetsp:Transcript_20064/g.39759  ORF Transcript_20064/g.39759 Transcript_20064/m.39759 type:complete len:207 (-) Transcript_20064:474-1094(-)